METQTESNSFKVKICGTTESSELNMLDEASVDYAGIWFLVPNGKYSLNRQQFSQLNQSPLCQLKCIGVTIDNNCDVITNLLNILISPEFNCMAFSFQRKYK